MKNAKKFRFTSMIVVAGLVVFSTNMLSAQIRKAPSAKPFTERVIARINSGFSFEIAVNPCFAGGKVLTIKIEKPEQYAYLMGDKRQPRRPPNEPGMYMWRICQG